MPPLEEQQPLLPNQSLDYDEEETAYEPTEKVRVIGVAVDDWAKTPPFSWKKLWLFTGPGLLMSIAFLDPGNLEGDLQAGAVAGDSLLWLLLWATAMGLLVQLLAARLGVATGRHLAELCRDEYPKWAGLVLWAMAELALIGADIQEVIGSAIAIKILSNGVVPLWAGVVITACDWSASTCTRHTKTLDTPILQGVLQYVDPQKDPQQNHESRHPSYRERVDPQHIWREGVSGFMLGSVYVAFLFKQRDVFVFLFLENYGVRKLEAVFAVFIATMGLSFAWMFGETKPSGLDLFLANSIGLINAGQYLQDKFGRGLFPILYIWGIGLLAAGQSSTITGTYAGQFIMGGFLNLRLKKWLRALITRTFAIVPTMIVALVFDTSEETLDVLNEWLNVLQSVQIPFALIPLLCLVSKEEVMGVFTIWPRPQDLIKEIELSSNGCVLHIIWDVEFAFENKRLYELTIFLCFSLLDGLVACGCLGDGDQRVSSAGVLLFRRPLPSLLHGGCEKLGSAARETPTDFPAKRWN
ncbi:NRAMP metal ion transporter 2 [Actinidia rufa]|uniref:NRAMP metal ion transporter 2 n=1 Tax=Actinidia rufa TaxID=165716 RepID=A0A7J0H6Y8_9ERIC|nr:NRAMP metal ion transporter 2 [Actinidia rufa]